MNTRVLATIGASGALAAILMQAVQISVFPPAPYLRWDPSDIVTLAVASVVGPGAGLLAVAVKCVLFLMMKGLDGPFGAAMNAVASGTFACVTGHVVRRLPRRGCRAQGGFELAVALGAGVCAMVLVMIPANFIVLPLQFGMSRAQVAAIVMPTLVPFNLIKGLLGAVLAHPVASALLRSSYVRRMGAGGDEWWGRGRREREEVRR